MTEQGDLIELAERYAAQCDWNGAYHAMRSAYFSSGSCKVETGLREAVRSLLPIGNDKLPGDRVVPIYVRMDELRALHALAAHPIARADEAWQPIETAPKDGTTIDVWRDGTRETVRWGLPEHFCGEMGQYCDSDWHSIKKPGWVCATFGEFVGGKHDPFTHWMPLPRAPRP